jgi:hypothetical protein
MSGDGVARTYTWHEEAFELEVSVCVPKETRAKDIRFQATPTSIDLRLLPNINKDDGVDTMEEIILLDKSRPLRGKVSLEGTFWVLSDPIAGDGEHHRTLTITIEKQIRNAKDDFDVIEYDWKGLYANENDDEVSYRKYDEAEELNVREYAASLGVDIDNLNMSLVDKSMFTSGLNLTKSSFDSLQEAGLMKEVTRQKDGSEWITNENGEREPFNSLGGKGPEKKTIPFLDTNSPWHKAVPVNKKDDGLEAKIPEDTAAEQEKEDMEKQQKEMTKELQRQREQQASDPIETLTVTRLKEILKSRGLKVSGNKKELQERLRAEVNTMMNQGSENKGDSAKGES